LADTETEKSGIEIHQGLSFATLIDKLKIKISTKKENCRSKNWKKPLKNYDSRT
jgi:hypothetical protein